LGSQEIENKDINKQNQLKNEAVILFKGISEKVYPDNNQS
jgi:hypothetical protein